MYCICFYTPLFDLMWPALHSTWRSSTSSTPATFTLPAQGHHFSAWPPSTSILPHAHAPGLPTPIPPHRDIPLPPVEVHHYPQQPVSHPPAHFGLPPPEPPSTLEQAAQLFLHVIRRLPERPSWLPSSTPTADQAPQSPHPIPH